MQHKQLTPFKIISMDSLGQGVSKETNEITFIPKTAPGDEGEATVLRQKKGVKFAKAIRLSKRSELRIDPICPHFSVCPSCHYLHVPYNEELKFKHENLERMLRNIPHPAISTISATHRTGYRNRIQLHYDTKLKLLGMFDSTEEKIVPVPECLIAEAPVKKELERLYLHWEKEAPSGQPRGHVEIYWVNNEVSVTWNRPYAEGGFTQVYQAMNEKLKTELKLWVEEREPTDLLDLFAGNGNLSDTLPRKSRLCVDVYHKTPQGDFLSQELYDKKALSRVKSELKRREMAVKTLLLDPPRSGLKELGDWLMELKPQFVAYVSCDPHTLVRDLKSLSSYEIIRVFLIDFFPSTFHFETMIFLERKE